MYPEEHCDLFTWKMTNFGEALRKAKSGWNTRVDSPPFYACGYKCKLELNPNGFNTGEHTHLSIYIRIMKGENDAILTWPFQKKVQVQMQTTGRTLFCPSLHSMILYALGSR